MSFQGSCFTTVLSFVNFFGDPTHTFLSYISYFVYYMIIRIKFWYRNNLVLIPCWQSVHTLGGSQLCLIFGLP